MPGHVTADFPGSDQKPKRSHSRHSYFRLAARARRRARVHGPARRGAARRAVDLSIIRRVAFLSQGR
jgi:hypothetical protein